MHLAGDNFESGPVFGLPDLIQNSSVTTDPYDLQRFVDAQQRDYQTALSELKDGKKRSHWIWYILPQLRGLGQSAMARRYGLSGLPEASAYLAHPLLGPRLVQCVEALLSHKNRSAEQILGAVDARKFQSCLSLFAHADPRAASCFHEALRQFYAGEYDAATLAMLH